MHPEKLRRIAGISGFVSFVSTVLLIYFAFWAPQKGMPGSQVSTYLVLFIFIGLLMQAILFVNSRRASLEFTGPKFFMITRLYRVLYPAILLGIFSFIFFLTFRFNIILLVFLFSMVISTIFSWLRMQQGFECIYFQEDYLVFIGQTIRVVSIAELKSIEINNIYFDIIPLRGVRLRIPHTLFADNGSFAFREALLNWAGNNRFSAIQIDDGSSGEQQ